MDTIESGLTADAIIRRIVESSLMADAILSVAQAASIAADATLFATLPLSVTADAIRLRPMGDVHTLDFPGTRSALQTGIGGDSNLLTGPIDVGIGNSIYIRLESLSAGNLGIFAGPTTSLADAAQNSYLSPSNLPQTYSFVASYRYVWVYSWTYSATKTGRGYADIRLPLAKYGFSANALTNRFGYTTVRSVDAYISGLVRGQHDRGSPPHYDNDLDTVIVLAKSIGVYQQGMDLHSVLTAIAGRVSDLESGL